MMSLSSVGCFNKMRSEVYFKIEVQLPQQLVVVLVLRFTDNPMFQRA